MVRDKHLTVVGGSSQAHEFQSQENAPPARPGGRKRGIYLAGPAVFAPAEIAQAHFHHAAILCEELQLQLLSPLDIELKENEFDNRAESRAIAIKRGNLELMMTASCVVADISPFRGPHMDPGTAYEIGWADALSLPVILYSQARGTLRSRYGRAADRLGYSIEDFGLCDNLMIAASLSGSKVGAARIVHATLEEALRAAAAAVVPTRHQG